MKRIQVSAMVVFAAGWAVFVTPALAQPYGSVSVTVENTFGSSVGETLQTCSGCSFTAQPPTSISNNFEGSYGVTGKASNAGFSTIVRYGASKSGQQYGCQFTAPESYSLGGGAACSIATPSAAAYAGAYPSPHCGYSTSTPDPMTCNTTVTFTIEP